MATNPCCDNYYQKPVNCACQQPAKPTCCSKLVVCCVEYDGVNDAWQKTGIPPHKLRYMAGSPVFEHIYWN